VKEVVDFETGKAVDANALVLKKNDFRLIKVK
jgi:hypothetical protein